MDRVADEVGLSEQAGELVEHGGVEAGCRDAFGVAGLGAVAVAGEADVVVVGSCSASGGGADVASAALGAAQQAGQQVVGAVGAPQREVVAALGEDLLRAVEEAEVDQRLVGPGVVGASEEDLADVDAVGRIVSTALGLNGTPRRVQSCERDCARGNPSGLRLWERRSAASVQPFRAGVTALVRTTVVGGSSRRQDHDGLRNASCARVY